MKWHDYLSSIDNQNIQFATMRPPGSAFATLERKVVIIAPKAAVNLTKIDDAALIPALIELLQNSQKAWAAEILLTAITGGDGKIVESFSGSSDEWWDNVGQNAYGKWHNWHQENKENIVWSKSEKIFVVNKSPK